MPIASTLARPSVARVSEGQPSIPLTLRAVASVTTYGPANRCVTTCAASAQVQQTSSVAESCSVRLLEPTTFNEAVAGSHDPGAGRLPSVLDSVAVYVPSNCAPVTAPLRMAVPRASSVYAPTLAGTSSRAGDP